MLPPTGYFPATESPYSKAIENLGALITCPIFPRAEGWWLLYITYSVSSCLLRSPSSIPSALPWTESRFCQGREAWASSKSSNRNLEICCSTWLWKLWALPGCYLWKLANFQPGRLKCICEIIHIQLVWKSILTCSLSPSSTKWWNGKSWNLYLMN